MALKTVFVACGESNFQSLFTFATSNVATANAAHLLAHIYLSLVILLHFNPIFLAVVGVSVAGTSILTSVGQFLLFALGMGLVIMVLTLGMAVFKGSMAGGLRRALPYIQPIGT